MGGAPHCGSSVLNVTALKHLPKQLATLVLCLAGSGEVHTEGTVQRFGARCTLALPMGRDHQIFNVGSQPLEIVGLFGATQ